MSKERELKLEEIYQKAQIPWNSLKEKDIFKQEVENIASTESQEAFSLNEYQKLSLITTSLIIRAYEFVNKINRGEKQVNDNDLKKLEKMLENLPEAIEGIKQEINIAENMGLVWMTNDKKEVIKTLEGDYKRALISAIQKEKTRRQNDRGGNNPPLPSDNSEINKRISSLQSQINSLEQKLRQNPNPDTSQQDKQELTRLKNELAALKAKQNQQNDKNPKSNDFPWGKFVGGGIVIAIILLAIILLYKKKWKVNKDF